MTSGLEVRGRFGKQDFVCLSDEDVRIAVRPVKAELRPEIIRLPRIGVALRRMARVKKLAEGEKLEKNLLLGPRSACERNAHQFLRCHVRPRKANSLSSESCVTSRRK